MEDFKNRLAAIRAYRGMSQAELAEASGVGLNTIARYEMGENKPGAENAVKLADALDCSIDVLLGRVPLL